MNNNASKDYNNGVHDGVDDADDDDSYTDENCD